MDTLLIEYQMEWRCRYEDYFGERTNDMGVTMAEGVRLMLSEINGIEVTEEFGGTAFIEDERPHDMGVCFTADSLERAYHIQKVVEGWLQGQFDPEIKVALTPGPVDPEVGRG